MQINHTGYRKEPLNATSGGDNPTPAQGGNTKWSLSSVPLTNGNGLAYYLPFLLLEVTGTFDNDDASDTVAVYWDRFISLLIDSISVQGAWHGSPINSASFRGVYAFLLGFVMGGYQHVERVHPVWGVATNTTFVAEIAIPLSIGLGVKPHHTAQLAALYRNATVTVNWSSAAYVASVSTAAVLTLSGARLSAMLLPSPELIMGPPIEIVDYTTPAPSSGTQLDFTDFGKTTGINGTENEAGVLFAMLMSSNNGFGGAFAPQNVTRIGVPWRDQPETDHLNAFVVDALAAMGPARAIGSVAALAAAGGLEDLSGYPNVMGAQYGAQTAGRLSASLLGIPIVNPGYQLDLSKIQAVSRNIKIQLTATQEGTHHLLAIHTRQWTMGMREAWREYVIKEGIAKEVLGDANQFTDYQWVAKTKNKQSMAAIDPKKGRFLPWKLQNMSNRRRTH